MGTWYSKDGKTYDTLLEKQMADMAWEKQRDEQSNLLSEQQKQTALIRKRIEEDRYNTDRIIAENKKLEEERTINEIFDNIGISRNTYEKFENYLTSFNDIDEYYDLNDKIDELYYRKELVISCIKGEKTLQDIDEDFIYDACTYKVDEEKLNKLNNKLETLKLKKSAYSNFKDENIKIKLLIGKISKILTAIFLITGIILEFNYDGANNTISALIDVSLVLFVLFLIPSIIYYYEGITLSLKDLNKKSDKINKQIEYELNRKDLGVELNKEKLVLLKDNIDKEINDNINKLNQFPGLTELYKKWDDFYEYRKNHYSKEIEKLLSDCSIELLADSFNLKFKKVNKDNKISDGNVEDYIAYFENHSK